MSEWYDDWQQVEHLNCVDLASRLDRRNLVREYESFNDVQLLNERLSPRRSYRLLEVGCATAEFARYLRLTRPQVDYYGVDISRQAVARAKEKYPGIRCEVADPEIRLGADLRRLGFPDRFDVVYAKDVLHHQTRPYEFLAALLEVASDAVIIRLRTRDVGATELDPEQSCQYHYQGWMPFLVLNVQELIAQAQRHAPGCEIVLYQHHMVLGGRRDRFLPKALYRKETGTAETAMGIYRRTDHPGRVVIEDRPDMDPVYTWDYRVKHAARQAVSVLWPKGMIPRPGCPANGGSQNLGGAR